MYLATSQTASQSIPPSRPAPYVLTASQNFLTNAEICFHSYFQALAVLILICADEHKNLLVLVTFSSRLTIQARCPFIREGLHRQSSQSWQQPASTQIIIWHLAFLGCPSSCLAGTAVQSVPFTSAAHCSSLSSILQLSHIMPHSLRYRTNTGEICLDGHFAVGCGWRRVMVVGVYFHKTNELGDPFVSIILGCLNYLWIHGF